MNPGSGSVLQTPVVARLSEDHWRALSQTALEKSVPGMSEIKASGEKRLSFSFGEDGEAADSEALPVSLLTPSLGDPHMVASFC